MYFKEDQHQLCVACLDPSHFVKSQKNYFSSCQSMDPSSYKSCKTHRATLSKPSQAARCGPATRSEVKTVKRCVGSLCFSNGIYI